MKISNLRKARLLSMTLAASCLSLGCASAAMADYPSVTQQRLDDAHKSTDWLTYYHSYGGESNSPATQIDPSNVKSLEMVWSHKFPADLTQGFEATPIVNGNFILNP